MGLDAGVTEVLSRSDGHKLRREVWAASGCLSKETTATGRARNRLHKPAEKVAGRGGRAKARRIRRTNLGRHTVDGRPRRGEAEVEWRGGETVREALVGGPSAPAVKDLSHMRSRTKSRKLSGIVPAGCALHSASVWSHDNHHGDRFQCLCLRHAGDADVIASLTIAARMDGPDIHLWTPKEAVRDILMRGSVAARKGFRP